MYTKKLIYLTSAYFERQGSEIDRKKPIIISDTLKARKIRICDIIIVKCGKFHLIL